MLPYEDPSSKKPTHPKRKEKYELEKNKAREILKEIQKLFHVCDFDDFIKIEKITQVIPINGSDVERKKCKSLTKNLHNTIFEHGFPTEGLLNSIVGFSSLETQRNDLLKMFEKSLLLIFKKDSKKMFEEKLNNKALL